MENNVLAKLKEFIKSKVELEKRLIEEFNLGQRKLNGQLELIGEINFLRELILELRDLVKSISEDMDATTTCDALDNTISIVGRVGSQATTPDGGVIFRINTQDGYIDFLYYGGDKDLLAFGMKVYVLGVCGENGTWIAQKVEIID